MKNNEPSDTEKLRELITTLGYDPDVVNWFQLIKVCASLVRVRTALRHANPESTREFFITGYGGKFDENGLPDRIMICPEYGVSWAVPYKKIDQTEVYEGI